VSQVNVSKLLKGKQILLLRSFNPKINLKINNNLQFALHRHSFPTLLSAILPIEPHHLSNCPL